MHVFDASSMIYAWENYPLGQFPPLWKWIEEKIQEQSLVIPRVAFDEVANKSPGCAQWLNSCNINKLEIDDNIVLEALRIKGLLGIISDNYHAKGVGENDILIIAVSSVHNYELVSDEKRQTILPVEDCKRKIPAVCDMEEVGIDCCNFIEFIKNSGEIFQ